jgi:hypothetical protein
LPYVEVHISNIARRNIHWILSNVAEGFITGFGRLGLEAMLEIFTGASPGRAIVKKRQRLPLRPSKFSRSTG